MVILKDLGTSESDSNEKLASFRFHSINFMESMTLETVTEYTTTSL